MRYLVIVVVLTAGRAVIADVSPGAADGWIGRCETALRSAQEEVARHNEQFNKGELRETSGTTCIPTPSSGGGIWCQEPPPGSPPGVEFVVEISERESFRAAIGPWQPNAVPHPWHRHTASAAITAQVWEDRAWGFRRFGFLSFVEATGERLSSKANFAVFKKALDKCAAMAREPKR